MYDPTRTPNADPVRGRGASSNPANRFETIHLEPEPSGCGPPEQEDGDVGSVPTVLYRDATRSVIARNESPDFGFEATFNPYRGCEHGCSYCYARPTHEYLGFSAGLDFETRIMVKDRAPELLREELSSRGWVPQPVLLSGVTDAYQPIERRLGLTRRCLDVFAEARNPVAVITKNHLVTRDVDILAELARVGAAAAILSITTLDPALGRSMEPRASTPARRLDAIRSLSEAGVPVGVNVAPVVPGLTETEIPDILDACRDAGASFASYVLLRLPHGVKDLFVQWVHERFPDRASRIVSRIRSTRGGRLYDSRFGVRGRGEGPFAQQIRSLFEVSRRRAGLDGPVPRLSTRDFRRLALPRPRDRTQTDLFS